MRQLQPEPYHALNSWYASVQQACAEAGLPRVLLDLVWIRVSQLNGCAYCLDLHNREAREHGEHQSRLDVLSAWRECGDLFNPRERAALAFAEAVTLVSEHGVPDDVYEIVSQVFGDEQIGALLMSISVINAYNRISIASAAKPPRRE